VDKAKPHLQFINFLESVLEVGVDFINCELLPPECKQLITTAELDLNNVTTELIISNLLCAEIEKSNLRLALGNLSKEVIHFLILRELESQDAVKGM
jgi:hypothetical protein